MKINIIDENARQQSISYFRGFQTGVFNTLSSLIRAREGGLSLSKLYKTIQSNYKVYKKRYEDEDNDQ